MKNNGFNKRVLESKTRLAMPIAMYPALALTGASVKDIVTNPTAQLDAQLALRARYGTPFLLSAMDLSTEAEAFGCSLNLSDTEVPTVTGRLITSQEQADQLTVPQAGDRRTGVYLEAVRLLRKASGQDFVLAGCIGPFSLAARLAGVSEALELTMTEPDLMHTLLEKCTLFLTNYIKAFQKEGAHSIIMAEPVAGLLSPRGLSAFSSAYIKRIGIETTDDDFSITLHNCGAKMLHLPAILETGLQTFHFGAPMDVAVALDKVLPEVVLCGNLDPSGVFVQMPPDEVQSKTKELLTATAKKKNFVISSGCDLPPNTSLSNLDAFFQAIKS